MRCEKSYHQLESQVRLNNVMGRSEIPLDCGTANHGITAKFSKRARIAALVIFFICLDMIRVTWMEI